MVDWGFVIDYYIYAFIIFCALVILGVGYALKYLESRKYRQLDRSYYRASFSGRRPDSPYQARKE